MHKYLRMPDRKWHIFLSWTRMIGGHKTLCNRHLINPEESDEAPPEEDLCRVCARTDKALSDSGS